jgi:pimeloyl-ACP methyl ester carboxylesterase
MSAGPTIARRSFVAGAVLVASAPIMAANNKKFGAPWTGGGTIKRAGGQINYRTIGPADGEPVLLLHKVGGWLADWRHVAPLLAARYRVIAMDMPGHGDSAMLGTPPFVMTVDENSASILSALSEIGVERFTVAGNSLGGICGIAMAAFHPERVRKLIVVSASLSSGVSRTKLDEQESHRDPALWTADWRPRSRSAQQVMDFATLDPQVEVERNLSRAKADRWVRPSERGVGLTDVPALLARVKAPTLLIYPDRGHYERYIEVGRRVLPSARIVQVMNTGSFIHQEKPAETAKLIFDFLGSPS